MVLYKLHFSFLSSYSIVLYMQHIFFIGDVYKKNLLSLNRKKRQKVPAGNRRKISHIISDHIYRSTCYFFYGWNVKDDWLKGPNGGPYWKRWVIVSILRSPEARWRALHSYSHIFHTDVVDTSRLYGYISYALNGSKMVFFIKLHVCFIKLKINLYQVHR